MKRYIVASYIDDIIYLINNGNSTKVVEDGILITSGEYCIKIHSDNTVDYYKFYEPNREMNPPNKIKDALRNKYGDDLIFYNDKLSMEAHIKTIEDAKQFILNSSIGNAKLRNDLSNVDWLGDAEIGKVSTNKTTVNDQDFRSLFGVSKSSILQALNILYPDNTVKIWGTHIGSHYSSNGPGASLSYTIWHLSIK